VVDGIRKAGEEKKIGICRFKYVDNLSCQTDQKRKLRIRNSHEVFFVLEKEEKEK
jgi:hypothetical protein